jgi:citrate synthase
MNISNQEVCIPNVFYSGIIYRALGIPTDMFTVMFAMGDYLVG